MQPLFADKMSLSLLSIPLKPLHNHTDTNMHSLFPVSSVYPLPVGIIQQTDQLYLMRRTFQLQVKTTKFPSGIQFF